MLDNVWNAARRLVGRRADDVPAAGAAEREPVALDALDGRSDAELLAMVDPETGRLDPRLAELIPSIMQRRPHLMGELESRMRELSQRIGGEPPALPPPPAPPPSGYTLRWPLAPSTARLMADLGLQRFESLPPEVQQSVLTNEWSGRELAGRTAMNEGRLDEAAALAAECAARAEQLADPWRAARSEVLALDVAGKRGDVSAAAAHRAAALRWWQQAGDSDGDGAPGARAMRIRAVLDLRLDAAMDDATAGRLVEAHETLDAIVAELTGDPTDGPDLGRRVLALTDRAQVRQWSNRWHDALADYDAAAQAAAALPELGRKGRLVAILQGRARVLMAPDTPVRDLDAARVAIAELETLTAGTDLSELRIVPALRSELAMYTGEWDVAAAAADEAADGLAAQGWYRAAHAMRLRAGLAFLELGAEADAARRIEVALAHFEAHGPPDERARALSAAARLAVVRGDAERGWSLAARSLEEVEGLVRNVRSPLAQQRAARDKLPRYDEALAVALAGGGPDATARAWGVAERAKGFYLRELLAGAGTALLDDAASGADGQRLAELEEELDLLEAEASAVEQQRTAAEDEAARAELAERLDRLRAREDASSRERHDLFERLLHRHPRWGALRAPAPLDMTAELAGLDPSWLAVSYFLVRPRTGVEGGATLHVFWGGAAVPPEHATVPLTPPMLDALADAAGALERPGDAPARLRDLVSTALVDAVLPARLLALLGAGTRRRLAVSLHGPLRGFPLHALPVTRGARHTDDVRLVALAPVQYVPTFALLPAARAARETAAAEGAARASARDVLLLGCPRDGFGDAPLDDVPTELAAVEGVWAARGATVRTVLLAPHETPAVHGAAPTTWGAADVLHVACHGTYPDERPFDAALRLGSAAVRASELFGTRLRAEVVALSACDVGRPARREEGVPVLGDPWLGLYLPLLYAGARHLAISQWEANSAVAVAFMTALHAALAEGPCPADAFQRATLAVSRKPDPSWANWVLVGLPTSTTV